MNKKFFIFKFNSFNKLIKINSTIVNWGLGIGDWGLANPQSPSPIPNPQSPFIFT